MRGHRELSLMLPVLRLAGKEEVLGEVVELFLVTDPAEGRAGLPAHSDAGVAAGQGLETGLGTELVLARLTAQPRTLEVGTPPETGLLARDTRLRTGPATLRVTTPGLTESLGAEAGQTTPLSTDMTTLERTTTHFTTRDV